MIGLRGVGKHESPTLHSLRKTVINNLMRSVFTNAQITVHTGHRAEQNIQPYANILGGAGILQQQSVMKRPNGDTSVETNRKGGVISVKNGGPSSAACSTDIDALMSSVARNAEKLEGASPRIHFHGEK